MHSYVSTLLEILVTKYEPVAQTLFDLFVQVSTSDALTSTALR